MNRSNVAVICLILIALGAFIIRPRVNAQTSVAAVQNGIPNQQLSLQGLQPLFNPDGTPITNGKCVQGPVTAAATTGLWTLNYSALGFTTITKASAQAISPTSSSTVLTNQYMANINSVTTTTMTGTVTSGTTVVLASFSLGFGPTATTVYASVCGN